MRWAVRAGAELRKTTLNIERRTSNVEPLDVGRWTLNLGRWLVLLCLVSPRVARGAPAIAPVAGKALSTIVFGSCAHQSRDQGFWSTILAARPDLFIFAGDNIYSDTYDMQLMRKKYAQLGAVPGFQKLRAQCPVLATWDDHDYGLNDAGSEFLMRVESRQNFLNFFEVPTNAPRRQHAGVYDAQVFGPPGQRVQVILLDTRYFRSRLKKVAVPEPGQGRYRANNDKSATLLGAAQWRWLEEQLRAPAEIRLLVSSIQLASQDHAWEKWMNFPPERQRFFDLVRKTKAQGLIVLSGDRHHAELSRMDPGLGYPLYDLTSSGLNMARGHKVYEPNGHRIKGPYFFNHFGVVRIDWTKMDPSITLEIRNIEGQSVFSQALNMSDLQRKAAPRRKN